MNEEFDYIIIGAGSAGCVVANRLIERTTARVLLIEAGPSDKGMFLRMPAGVPIAIARRTWPYSTEPDHATGSRRMGVAQGKVLGGGSSVNGMIYIRGQREDFDDWRDQYGCTGWDFEAMLPYFRRAEANESLSNVYHAIDGPLPVSDQRYRHPLSEAFIRAGQEAGLSYTPDFNGEKQAGVGWYQTTTRGGERASTAQTYLKAVSGNPRLKIVTDALVQRVVTSQGRATGVVYAKGGTTIEAAAAREVVVSAGAIGSPKVLLLSGIGPAADLHQLGIAPVADLPVGRNYHDHLHVSVNAATLGAITLDGQDSGLKAMRNGVEWILFRRGVVSSNILEAGAFIDTTGDGRPDAQIHFLPLLDRWDDPDGITNGHAFGLTLKIGHLRPKARGTVTLASPDPADMVKIWGNHLGHADDIAGQLRAVKAALNVASAPSLRALTTGVFSPASQSQDRSGQFQYDDAELEAWIRRTCKTVYHPVGTCRMGQNKSDTVVDLQLRVHGIDGLRVVDASTFPAITSGNTNAPTIALAEKAADLIIGSH